MKCPRCEKEFTSEKIYAIHTQKCKEQPPEKTEKKETNKPTQRKHRQKT